MIWIVLAALGVPLWLCAVGILTLVLRNRSLRKRGGDIPVRLRKEPGGRWTRGHAMWVHDVLAFRASPAGWSESLLWVTDARVRAVTPEEATKLRRLGDAPVVAHLALDDGTSVDLAAAAEHRRAVAGPYAEIAGAGGVASPGPTRP